MPESLLPHPDQRLLTSLFLGTALSISSIKIVAAVVREMGFTRRNLGQIIVASAICEDSIGWVIIAITFSLAEAGTHRSRRAWARACWAPPHSWSRASPSAAALVFFLIRWANDNFESDFPVITTILVIMGAMALTTHFIGVHTVLGAFVAGVLIGESPILTQAHRRAAARPHSRVLHAGVLRHRRACPPTSPSCRIRNSLLHGARPDRDRQRRQVRRRLHRRRDRRPDAGARRWRSPAA